MLTTYDVDDSVFAALRAGASGFMLKDVRPAELAEAVRVVARGDALLAPSVTRRLLDRVRRHAARPGRAPPPDLRELTDREVEVLRLVALALSNAEIAQRLVLTEATVKTHVSSVLRKLGLRDRVQAVVLAYDVGLVRPRSVLKEGTRTSLRTDDPPPPRRAERRRRDRGAGTVQTVRRHGRRGRRAHVRRCGRGW